MSAVYDADALPRRLVPVALVLAYHADADGGSIRPSVATVARYARTDRRNAQRYIRELEQLGVIRLIRRGGAGAKCCSEYRMDLERLAGLDEKGGIRTAHAVATEAEKGGSTTAVSETAGVDKGGTKSGTESGAGTARSRKGNEEHARARPHEKPGSWIRPDSAEAREQLRAERTRQLGELEVAYVSEGFRTALAYETPMSYRTAFDQWQRNRRANGAGSHA